jgi:hypothetical protein
MGVFLVIGAAVTGALATVLTGGEPGIVLGIFVAAGTVAAALAVRPRAVYLIVPVPAPAYVVAAVCAGFAHDRAADTSHTALAVTAAQWVASGFIAMAAATIAAIAVTAARWPRNAGGPSHPPPAGRAGRPRRDQATRSPSARPRRPRDLDYPASAL